MILNNVIEECIKHSNRMNYAFVKLSYNLPFIFDYIINQNEYDIALLDQFIFRFAKLQDAIGQKLFKTLLITLDENVENKSAIDIFNRLEQLEIISDYDKWKELRNLRNELSHACPV